MKSYRQSTNIIDMRKAPDPVSKTLFSSKPIDTLPLPKSRVGTLEPFDPEDSDDSANGPGTDAPFFKHTSIGN